MIDINKCDENPTNISMRSPITSNHHKKIADARTEADHNLTFFCIMIYEV